MTLMRVIFTFIITLTVVFMVPAATLDDIDTAAEEFGSFITGKVADKEGYSIAMNPFL